MKLTLVGAGSVGFTRNFAGDVLLEPKLEDVTFCLFDPDAERLGLAETYVKKLIEADQSNAKVEATTDRAEALRDAFAVVVTIRVAEESVLQANFTIPAKYGMRQTIADTVGPSGVFYGAHNAPVLLDICREMEDVCPDAVFLNYTNPMAIVTAVHQHGSPIRSLGMCHNVQYGIQFIARVLDIPQDEIDFEAAGVNHCSWFTELTHNGRDLYPEFRERGKAPEVFKRESVRFDLMECFGCFPTEGSTHHAEYHPYYLHHDSEIERLFIQRVNTGIEAFSGKHRANRVEQFQKLIDDPNGFKLRQSVEYYAPILKALTTDEPELIYASVLNRGYVDNLPPDCAVEIPIMVDRRGFHPIPVGSLPPGPAARTAALAHHQYLAAMGILQKDLELIRQSILVDPNTSATLSTPQIRQMTDELIEANRAYLEGYC